MQMDEQSPTLPTASANHSPTSIHPLISEPGPDVIAALDGVDIDAAYAALGDTPDDELDKLDLLDDVGYLYLCRFDYLADLADLDRSVSARDQALLLTPKQHLDAPRRMMDLSTSLMRRFDRLGVVSNMNRAISLRSDAILLIPDSHGEKIGYLNDLGVSLISRFERYGNLEDIDEAISKLEHGVRIGPIVHPHRHPLISNLSSAIIRRLEHFGDTTHFNHRDSMAHLMEEITYSTSDTNANKPSYLNNVGVFFMLRFKYLGDILDLGRAIAATKDAVRLTPDRHPNKPGFMTNLANAYSRRFERVGTLQDIEKSILILEEAMELTPSEDPKQADLLDKLGHSFLIRFTRLGSFDDLDRSISTREGAVRLLPDDHSNKPGFLSNLGVSILRRFERLGNLPDITRSIFLSKTAVQLTSDQHPEKPGRLMNLGNSYMSRFDRLGNIADVEKATKALDDAMRLVPGSHPDKPMLLKAFGNAYILRFKATGILSHMEKSISSLEDAFRLLPPNHPDKPSFLNDLNLTSLTRSVDMLQDALNLTPDGHPRHVSRMNLLGNTITRRFERFGDLVDIEHADDDPDKPLRLDNLGSSLMRRFERLGSLTDIDNAILNLENAPVFLNNLATSYLRRFERNGITSDINRSISLLEIAVKMAPDSHLEKLNWLNHLGCSFACHLDRSIETLKDAKGLASEGHAYTPYILSNLGGSAPVDLEESITVRTEAVKLLPHDHPDRPAFLSNIGKHLGNIADLNDAVVNFSSAALSTFGAPSVRFHAAWQWGRCVSHTNSSPLTAYRCALDLLPRVAWLGLPIGERHALLRDSGAIVRDAASAAISLHEYNTALEWLEQGRSIVWGQLHHLRTPVDDLRIVNEVLAMRIAQVSEDLEYASTRHVIFEPNASLTTEQLGQKHRRLAEEWDELLGNARAVPGFEEYLKPQKLTVLKNAARNGPVVVVNVHQTRCDALILTADRESIRNVSLERFSYKSAQQMQISLNALTLAAGLRVRSGRHMERRAPHADGQDIKGILQKLWRFVVKPVLDVLELPVCQSPTPPRVWWCPTGPLTFLPIHAAGLYNSEVLGSNVMDYVVSSYTPTLSTILNDHRKEEGHFKLLTVIQPSTPGAIALPGTEGELAHIERHIGNLSISRLEKGQATIEAVMTGISECNWVHFACHGKQDTSEPTKSGLLLHNGRLELSDLIKKSLPHAEFAFLSACQTATGDKDLSEEAVHLAAGMLMVGFKGAIATMWSIKDNDAPFIADDQAPKYTRAAHALHIAIKRLREQGAPFLSWVPFIHVGG
ncbi:hypothetical protein K439DRAFT_1654054 [Ramaria rubella]|nr:hypothetical protein K439DRAFT_1654054 [Ramaria rubella]